MRARRVVKKCVVLNCTNRSSEGKFVGDMCAPCYRFVSEGEGQYSQAFRNALVSVFERLFRSAAELASADPTSSVRFDLVARQERGGSA